MKKPKSKGIYVSHLKAIKRKAKVGMVLEMIHESMYWGMVALAGFITGIAATLIF
jgi:hypothetical protein